MSKSKRKLVRDLAREDVGRNLEREAAWEQAEISVSIIPWADSKAGTYVRNTYLRRQLAKVSLP